MGISLIECGFGYVESSTVGKILYATSREVEFGTEFEALQDLARGLYRKYRADHDLGEKKRHRRSCCEKTLKQIPEAEFCTKCRSSFKESSVDFEEFAGWLRMRLLCDAESWGDEIGETYTNGERDEYSVGGWTPWNSSKEVFARGPEALLVLPQEAEVFLIEALGEEGVDPIDLPAWKDRDMHVAGHHLWDEDVTLAKFLTREYDKYNEYHISI